MPVALTFNAEEGVDGAALTVTGNYQAVSPTAIYANVAARHGTKGYRFSDTTPYFRANQATIQHGGSMYVKVNVVPSGAARLAVFMEPTTNVFHGMIRAHSDGKFDIATDVAARVVATTNPYVVGQWYRIDYQFTGAALAHTLTVRIFNNPESTVFQEEISGAVTGASGTFGRMQFGAHSSGVTTDVFMDTIRLYDTVEWAAPQAPGGIDRTDGYTLQYHMNRLAGTLFQGIPTRDACAAANIWAGTTNLEIVGALNVKANNVGYGNYLDLAGVLNQLAGTTNLEEDGAAASIP